MKTRLAYILFALLLAGCSNIDDRQLCVNYFGTAEVVQSPDSPNVFIIRDTNGAIWLANPGIRTDFSNCITKLFDAPSK